MENSAARPQATRVAGGKMVAGVCAGLARYFALDATLVRLLFLVFTLVGGAGVLAYIVLWIVMPLSTDPDTTAAVAHQVNNEFIAMALIAVGALWLLANLGTFAFVQWRFAWPLALVVLGVALLVRRTRS